MTTKSLQIRDVIVGLLTASTCGGVPVDRIYTDIAHAIEPVYPSIAVELGDEPAPQRSAIQKLDRQVMVKVQVISAATTGIDATTAADPPIVEASRRIMADITLGGISFDIQEQDTQRLRDELTRPVLLTTLNYSVFYITGATSREV
jgi:hypothetical protein